MATLRLPSAYDRFLDQVVQKMTPEEILAFELSPEEQARTEELMDHHEDEVLTSDEQVELDQLIEFDQMMSLLKAKAVYELSKK